MYELNASNSRSNSVSSSAWSSQLHRIALHGVEAVLDDYGRHVYL